MNPGADHHDMLRGADPLPQHLALIEVSQVTNIGKISVGQIEQAVAGTGRQHQMPVIKERAGGEHEPLRSAVDEGDAIADQFDVLVAIELVGPEHQAVGTPLALEIGLGQRRPLIGQMRLVVDQADTFAKAMLAQGDGNLETGVAGADDQDSFLGHELEIRVGYETDFRHLAGFARDCHRLLLDLDATDVTIERLRRWLSPKIQPASPPAIRRCSRSMARLRRSRLTGLRRSTRSIFRSPNN